MRDPKRIDEIMNVLTDIWKDNSDFRFGQLMSNVLGEISQKNSLYDIFFPEDDKWLKWLQEYKEGHSVYNYGQNLNFVGDDDGR